MFSLTTFLNITTQQSGEILHIEAVLGYVQKNYSSAVNWSNFGKSTRPPGWRGVDKHTWPIDIYTSLPHLSIRWRLLHRSTEDEARKLILNDYFSLGRLKAESVRIHVRW